MRLSTDTVQQALAQLRVVVVARQPVVRAGLRGLIADIDGIRVVGAFPIAEEALELVVDSSTDVVLAAWETLDPEGTDRFARTLAERGIPLVLLGDIPLLADLGAAVRAGARGFLLSEAAVDEVEATLKAVSRGLLVLSPVLGRALPSLAPVTQVGVAVDEDVAESPLTEREREVLGLLALGLANKAIARRLNVSDHTVKFHVGSILAKLDAGSRTEAVTRAARRGLLAL